MSKRIYLCGKCTGLSFEEMNGWRKKFTYLIESNSIDFIAPKIFNPCNAFGQEWYEKELSFSEKLKIKDFDLTAIRSSNLVVVNCKNIESSVGSVYEIAVAKELKIPIIGFNISEKLHDWIKTSLDWECEDLIDAVDYIQRNYNYLWGNMTNKANVTGIVFYRDYYDNGKLLWVANKPYKVVSVDLVQKYYSCESETGEIIGMDIINNNRYALIYNK